MKNLPTVLSIFLYCFVTVNHAQVTRDTKDMAKQYLERYGYIDYYLISDYQMTVALKHFQRFSNLNITGELDAPTLNLMTQDRCGMEDPFKKREERYKLQGTSWTKRNLKWRLHGECRTLGRSSVLKIIRKALMHWSTETNIDFTETSSENEDILIQFKTGRHRDPLRFDGKGGILGHAFYPYKNIGLAGDIHLDDAEDYNEKSLLWLMHHEIGHSLGLEHSNIRGSIMYPWNTNKVEDVQLTDDDISGIQAIYGVKTKTPPTSITKVQTTTKATKATKATKVTKVTPSITVNAKNYLRKYGYASWAIHYDLKKTLKRFQYFANLGTTGVLDAATLKQMTIPRCGVEDPKIKIKERSRGYVHQGSTWKKRTLTWHLKGECRTLDRVTVLKLIRKALSHWSKETNIDFTETTDQMADIKIEFKTGFHADPFPFDGKGGSLGHAFYPLHNKGLSGDIHIDDAEDHDKESLFWLIIHEIGHSLGLEHSNIRGSIMYPWNTNKGEDVQLSDDDISGIREIYGTRTKTTTRPTLPTRSTSPISKKRVCPSSRIAAVYYNSYAKITILLTTKPELYFVNQRGGIKYGPIKTSNYFPRSRIRKSIDAAFHIKIKGRKHTVFFAGENYYIYQHFRFRSGPHSIHGNRRGNGNWQKNRQGNGNGRRNGQGNGNRRRNNKRADNNPLNLNFPSTVRKIDAAMTWHRNEKTYFFVGLDYYRYNNQVKKFDKGYPRNTQSAWIGLPEKIDAAYSSSTDKRTFFVSGNQYYLLHDNSVSVDHGYPEHVGREWLNCGGRESLLRSSADVTDTRKKRPDP